MAKGRIDMARILLFAGGALAVLIIIALLAGMIFFYGQNKELAQEYISLEAEHNQTLAELSGLQLNYSALGRIYAQANANLQAATISLSTANSEIARLNAQLAAEKQQLAQSNANLQAQQQKAAQIASDLGSLERSIGKSMAWFSENAALPKNCTWDKETCWKSDTFRKRVAEDCVDKGNLNLACITYLMEHTTFSIRYRTDSEKGSEDHLQGVKETMQAGSGDCEDYSFIFKAIINSMAESAPGLEAVAYTGGGSGDFRVYPKESIPYNEVESYWYVPGAKGISLGNLSRTYPYVICYSLTEQAGHCTVALSQHKITGSAGIYSLNGAQVFEPQNGQYIGTVGNELALCASQQECFGRAGQIRIVIADSDLYSFENGNWVGYADYLSRVESAKAEIGS